MAYKKIIYPKNFCGVEDHNFAKAKVAVLPVPYEGTVSYGGGTAKGPEAIIKASPNLEFYDWDLDAEPLDIGIYTLPALKVKNLSPEKMVKAVEKKYEELLQKNKFVLMLGGEHAVSCGVIAPLKKKYKEVSVLQWDAHADLRDTYEGTPYSHACAMRRFYDGGFSLTQAGVRSLSKEEADFIKQKKLRGNIFTPAEFDVKKIVSRLKKNVYVTVDMDGFDPALVPATGTPEPGGLSWQNFTDLMREVFTKKNVVGCDVVELAPIAGHNVSDFVASLAAYKMIGYKFY
ncbi:MAG: agmatinase [bacterium]|nr:agmatinase [bacterium]